jgi:two-component system phosphate regulon sensor histidine kinase PhoR
VLGDADQLLRVWLNLLDNAVKYCRPDDQVTVSLRREGAGVRGAVSDDGPGIAREHLPHLTQRFYRAAPLEQAGSGLGLALVEEILRQHGSTLQIESQIEGDATGTRLHFLLPTVAQPKEAL